MLTRIDGVDVVQGDFTEDEVFERLLELLGDRKADVVIFDMAPNMSGMAAVDIPRAIGLVELALDMARQVLRPGGVFVAKVFQGEGFDALLADMRDSFKTVVSRKPVSGRPRKLPLLCGRYGWAVSGGRAYNWCKVSEKDVFVRLPSIHR